MMTRRMDEEKSSESSSGCQSGWTMYLDQSNEKLHSLPYHNKPLSIQEEGEDEDEDLSMVSDASSGPPHEEDHEERYYCNYCSNGRSCSASLPSHVAFADNAGKNKRRRRRVEADTSSSPPLLDDTASSPFLNFSKTSCTTATTATSNNKKNKKNVTGGELSCGFSATHFEARPAALVTRLYLDSLQSTAPAKPYSVSLN